MPSIRSQFTTRGFDAQEYRRYFHRHTEEHLRTKLRCVECYAEGQEFTALCRTLHIHWQTARTYINQYIAGGFAALCQGYQRPRMGRLTKEQEQAFMKVILTSSPREHGLDGNIWTGTQMCFYLERTYAVMYKSGIYDLLERLGLSHQRAHADYGNADSTAQAAYLQELTETLAKADTTHAVLSFDEFSLGASPTPYYGWAKKNTRPTVTTDEKKSPAPTVCLP
jgi:transposase